MWRDVFYGGNVDEGLYGLMWRMHDYLLNYSHDWSYAAWFVSKGGQDNICTTEGDDYDEPNHQTYWLWGDNYRADKNDSGVDEETSAAACFYNETVEYWLDYPNPITC